MRLDYGRGQVLTDVDLDVAAGCRVALSGPNGAGKSSVLALVAGLYRPTAGRVLIGGVDLETLEPGFLRRHIAVVLQDTFLFSGSVIANVLLGRPDASTDEVVQACAAAGVLEFADGLPQGLGTQLGDRGVGLSGGQRQRVGIARALLRKSPIVLLDEPTSGLDLAAERTLVDALKRLMNGRTVVMTTHRPALLALADRIETLVDGRLEPHGAPGLNTPQRFSSPAPDRHSSARA
ncbi:MAG: ATP-binding cassette domain-containing protein [Oryzihumus sp.]